MPAFSVLLTSVSDVRKFADAAGRCRCEVNVLSGRHRANGKSILDLFSLDLSGPVTVEVYGTDEEVSVLRAETAAYAAE